jgi:hypothetical protein
MVVTAVQESAAALPLGPAVAAGSSSFPVTSNGAKSSADKGWLN